MVSEAATEGRPDRTPKRNGGPGPGRPHDLDRPIPTPGGSTTAAQAILDLMRIGLPIAEAAQATGVDRATAYRWRGDGAYVLASLANGTLDPDHLTDYQHAAATFYDGAMQAEADAEARNAETLGTLARGGYVTERTVIEYDANDKIMSKRVTKATVPPDTKAVTFWLERRAPERWGRAQRIEIAAGAEGPLVQTDRTPLDRLAEALTAIERRKAARTPELAPVDTAAQDGAA